MNSATHVTRYGRSIFDKGSKSKNGILYHIRKFFAHNVNITTADRTILGAGRPGCTPVNQRKAWKKRRANGCGTKGGRR